LDWGLERLAFFLLKCIGKVERQKAHTYQLSADLCILRRRARMMSRMLDQGRHRMTAFWLCECHELLGIPGRAVHAPEGGSYRGGLGKIIVEIITINIVVVVNIRR